MVARATVHRRYLVQCARETRGVSVPKLPQRLLLVTYVVVVLQKRGGSADAAVGLDRPGVG
eukprot:9332579-Pyramimonas_sp.AAC.1